MSEDQAKPQTTDDRRQYVNFAFYKVDPGWRRLPEEERRRGKCQLIDVVKSYEQDSIEPARPCLKEGIL